MALIPPFFMDAVVALGNRQPDGGIVWVASGFLYGSRASDQLPEASDDEIRYVLWLVTNRHVVLGLDRPVVRFDGAGGTSALPIDLPVHSDDGESPWHLHPDPEVDVGVVGINPDFLREAGARISFFAEGKSAATLAELKALGVSEGQAGFLLGFPMSMVHGPTNAVIVRQACIARIRDAYEGSSRTFLVDGTVFPGNSGGPAVVRPEIASIQGTAALSAAYLIGVVTSYVPYRDVAVSQQTGQPRITFEENSGLTSVCPVDGIQQTITFALANTAEATGGDTTPDTEPG